MSNNLLSLRETALLYDPYSILFWTLTGAKGKTVSRFDNNKILLGERDSRNHTWRAISAVKMWHVLSEYWTDVDKWFLFNESLKQIIFAKLVFKIFSGQYNTSFSNSPQELTASIRRNGHAGFKKKRNYWAIYRGNSFQILPAYTLRVTFNERI